MNGPQLPSATTPAAALHPKYLQDAAGDTLEERDDPVVTLPATLRSVVMRGAESTALRGIVLGSEKSSCPAAALR